jgi:hypothetical protein
MEGADVEWLRHDFISLGAIARHLASGLEGVTKPADASELKPIFKWETLREVGPRMLPYEKSLHQAPLTCRLRPKKASDHEGRVSPMGEVELENCSTIPLEIEYTMTPLQFFELEVIASDGRVVSEGHFSDRLSPMREPAVLCLQPGARFTANVSLLATVPRDRRRPGTYTVQASYRFQDQQVMAEPLTVALSCGA